MDDIIYREIEKSDYKGIKSLINTTWNIDSHIRNKKTLDKVLDMYLRLCLMESSYGRVAVKDGSIVGIVLGNANNDKKRYGVLSHALTILVNALTIPFSSKTDRRNIIEYRKIDKAYHELIAGKKNLFEGEVVFLAVSEDFRGFGIGKTLINALKNYFKAFSVKSIYVYTDTSCNYGFYDSQGFILSGVKDVNMKRDSEPFQLTVFMYSYELS